MIISQYHPGTRWRLRVLRATLPISAHDAVLDAGCGDGYISSELATLAKAVVGVDIAQGIVEQNQKNFSLPNLSFVVGDLRTLQERFAASAFSTVVCTDVFEHTHGFRRILGNYSYVLRTDGFLYFTVPLGNHGHFKYSVDEVADILVEKGFRVVHLAKIGPPPFTSLVMYLFRWASTRLYGRSRESDVWTDTQAFTLSHREPHAVKLYRLLVFPIMHRLTYLDRKPYASGNTLPVLSQKRSDTEGGGV